MAIYFVIVWWTQSMIASIAIAQFGNLGWGASSRVAGMRQVPGTKVHIYTVRWLGVPTFYI